MLAGIGSLSEIPTPPWLHFVLAVPSTHGPGRASFLPSSPADFLQLNEKQDIVSNQPFQGKDFHGEEIRPHQNFHV